MNLLEYEAKAILKSATIQLPLSELIQANQSSLLVPPVVLKSQVPTGGRSKAGGIKIVDTPDQIQTVVNQLLSRDIKGFIPSKILVEEKINIKNELYLSILIDRKTSGVKLIGHSSGGIDIEDSEGFFTETVSPHNSDLSILSNKLAGYYGLSEHSGRFLDLLKNLILCLVHNDATLIEINPLILTTDNKLIAGDCKMILDDSAVFRHPNWDFYDKPAETNFVEVNPNGKIATIANGAGLAMATLDAAHEEGLKPINFLDIGGGANESAILNTFKKLSEYHDVQGIIINIFAGITRCDEVARAIITASNRINHLPNLYIRLSGTNYKQAKILLDEAHIPLYPDLKGCLKAVKKDIS